GCSRRPQDHDSMGHDDLSLAAAVREFLAQRVSRAAQRRFSSCVTDAFDTLFENLVEGLVSRLVPVLLHEGLRAGPEPAAVTFSGGQAGRTVRVAVEDEEVLAVANPTETEFAEPAQLLVGCCS